MDRVILLLLFISVVTAAPVGNPKKPPSTTENPEEHLNQLEYERYLKQTVELLGRDSNFQNKIQNATEEDIKTGRIADHLGVVSGDIRSKLDEVKRIEIERLVELHQMAAERGEKKPLPRHLQHRTERFNEEDLRTLIKSVHSDIEENRKLERKAFSEHEMKERYEYEQRLQKLSAEERKKAEENHDAMKKKHKDHEKFNHPGSERQIEEVWKEDGMDVQDFNAHTLFKLHDTNGDNVWDMDEQSAFFQHEIGKAYERGHEEDDLEKGHEERERMREHLLKEADIDGDGMLSLAEFERQANRHEVNETWEDMDSAEQYTPDQYQQYQERVRADLARQGVQEPVAPVQQPTQVLH